MVKKMHIQNRIIGKAKMNIKKITIQSSQEQKSVKAIYVKAKLSKENVRLGFHLHDGECRPYRDGCGSDWGCGYDKD